MTDLHPAAKPEHVRQVLDNLKALETRLIIADMSRDEPNGDAHLVGKAIIVIESLGSELDMYGLRRREIEAFKLRELRMGSQIQDLLAELKRAKGPCSNKKCELHYAHSGPCNTHAYYATLNMPEIDPDYIHDGIKGGWLDEDGNVNEPPDVEP